MVVYLCVYGSCVLKQHYTYISVQMRQRSQYTRQATETIARNRATHLRLYCSRYNIYYCIIVFLEELLNLLFYQINV